MEDIVVPTFLIGGAPKAGTTSLYNYLAQHPNVCMSARKETGIFMENYDKGLGWLSETYYRHYDGEKAIGEASAGVMQMPECAERIHETLPNVKLLFVLRDPVERLYSHYRFLRGVGALKEWEVDEDASFSELIRAEGTEWRRVQVDLGMYHKHLTRFERYFDREQMLVLLFRDLCESPDRVVRRCFEFLDVSSSFEPDVQRQHNVSRTPRFQGLYRLLQGSWAFVKEKIGIYAANQTAGFRRVLKRLLTRESNRRAMKEADRDYLSEIYREPNRKLETWLNQDLSHWC